MEEHFFRNFFGYLVDCRKTKQSPSPFQMFRFMYSVNAPPEIPVPGPAWVGRQASWAVMMGMLLGGCLLGYKASYEEYYDDEKVKWMPGRPKCSCSLHSTIKERLKCPEI
jgi:hypothetical protein